eukprot:1160432-Pelagomonas_calceolata.AAC.14
MHERAHPPVSDAVCYQAMKWASSLGGGACSPCWPTASIVLNTDDDGDDDNAKRAQSMTTMW